MIIQVSYARLYNTGNYENVRFEAVVSVEDGNVDAAFAEASTAVHTQYKQYQADIEAEAQRQRDEWEAKRAAKRAKANDPMF